MQRARRSSVWGDLDEDTLEDLWATFGGGSSHGRARSRSRGHKNRPGHRESRVEEGQERSIGTNDQDQRNRDLNVETEGV